MKYKPHNRSEGNMISNPKNLSEIINPQHETTLINPKEPLNDSVTVYPDNESSNKT